MVNLWLWIGFSAIVVLVLALDLGVFHRRDQEMSFSSAVRFSALWVLLALSFNTVVWYFLGQQKAIEFLTGYLVEKTLSIDNIFVFVVLFSYFQLPARYQHRVLFWGVIGALLMRAILIAAGISLIERFHWMVYIFGAFLIITAIKLVTEHGKQVTPERNPLLRIFKRLFRVTESYEGASFFVKRGQYMYATPLFVVLLMVEFTDLVFAVDSIPAILAITRDPFIVYTSNVFAILGLRAMYFALAGFVTRLHLLHYGLAAVLAFVGVKLLLSDVYKFPAGLSLAVIAGLITAAALASILLPQHQQHEDNG